jgi:hypothetical protein
LANEFETPCPAPKRGIPWELKYDYAIGGYAFILKAFLYAIREEYGPETAIKMKQRVDKMGDRVKNWTKNVQKIFNIEGNDAATIGKVFDLWAELCGQEVIILERSKTIERRKYTKCPWKTEPKDLTGWCNGFNNEVGKTINPKTIVKTPKLMCAGDPYCEFTWHIEE